MSASDILHKFLKRNLSPLKYTGRTVFTLDDSEPYLYFSPRSLSSILFFVMFILILLSLFFLRTTRELTKLLFNITSDTENFVLDTLAYSFAVEFVGGGILLFWGRHKFIDFQNKLTNSILELVVGDESFTMFKVSIEHDFRKITRLQNLLFWVCSLNVVIFPLSANFHALKRLWSVNNIGSLSQLYIFWTTGLTQRHLPR